MDVPIERREALLAVAVHVLGSGVARLLDGLEERVEERARGRAALQDERPVVAAIRVVGRGPEGGLEPLEVRQAVGVVPVGHARDRCPALVVERVAALEDHPVDRGRAAEHLAAGVVDAPAVHVGLGLRPVGPVVQRAADRERQRGGHVQEDVEPPVGPARLEDEDARRGILATGGSRARSRRTRRRRSRCRTGPPPSFDATDPCGRERGACGRGQRLGPGRTETVRRCRPGPAASATSR